MDNQNKKPSFFEKVLGAIGSFFKTIGRWVMRAFFPNRELMKEQKKEDEKISKMTLEEQEEYAKKQDAEEIVTPFKQYVRGFKEHKLAVVSLFIVIFMFLFMFIVPCFFPNYNDNYREDTQQNLAPNMSLLSVPSKLKKEGIQDISSYGPFSVGLSKEGNVYVWGCTILGTTKIDVSKIPDEVKNANIKYISAGYDHIIAIDDKGKVYGWGSNLLGQYGEKPSNAKKVYTDSIYFSDVIPSGKVDPNNVKKLLCGYQVSGILMNDGTLYLWGNGKACNNLEKLSLLTYMQNINDFTFTKNDMVAIKDGALLTGKVGRYEVVRTTIGGEGIDLTTFLNGRTIKSVCSDNSTICLTLSDNTVCYSGDFGTNTVQVPTLAEGEYFTSIAGGTHHYSGVTNQGNVYSWGSNTLNQCNTKKIKGEATEVFVGANQNYVINSDGKLLAKWGHAGYLFGTDANGASVFQRLVSGGKMTLTIGGVAVIISTIIGIIIGCISGYFGGKVDILLMRLAEIVSAIPFLPFAMILSTLMGRVAISENMRIFIIMVILGVLSWPGLAHMVRGQVLVVRENEYVTAAKAMGVKESTIAFKHILPNVISIIIVSLTLDFAGCMLTESSLSYLGFGVQLPKPTWGNMLNAANNSTTIQNFWWEWFFPAIFLAITTICINMIGDALRDVMDPKSTADR